MEQLIEQCRLSGLDTQIDAEQRRLISAIQKGLPLVDRPYAAIAREIGSDESRVLKMIAEMQESGLIRRFGVVVRHHEAGYCANAMIVWDVPDEEMDTVPHRMKEFPFVTLCYRRPRRPPSWPYNLFCMIHGRDRSTVLDDLQLMIESGGWQHLSHEVLFSKRRFKQRGARYVSQKQERQAVVYG